MTIETKYNIGDEVGYLPLNPVLSYVTNASIRWISIEVFNDGSIFITYTMDNAERVTEDRILPK